MIVIFYFIDRYKILMNFFKELGKEYVNYIFISKVRII